MINYTLFNDYDFLYTSTDKIVFNDKELAIKHAETLPDTTLLVWFEEWSGSCITPNIVYHILNY